MTNRPLVTVIVVAFNRPEMLARALRSVLSQTYRDLEVLVIDDGSSIDLAPTVAAIHDPRISYHKRSLNLGLSGARNRGMELARGSYIALLDDDDEWRPEKLEKQVRDLQRREEAYRLSYTLRDVLNDQSGQLVERACFQGEGDILEKLMYNELLETPSSWLLEADALREIGGFTVGITWGEDWDFLLRYAQKYKVALVPERLILKHEHGGVRLSTNLDGQRRMVDSLSMILSNNRALFRSHPKARSALLVNLAYYQGTVGDRSAARQTAIRAILAFPFWASPYFSAAMAFKR